MQQLRRVSLSSSSRPLAFNIDDYLGPQIAALLLSIPNAYALQLRFAKIPLSQSLPLHLCNVGQFLALAWFTGLARHGITRLLRQRGWRHTQPRLLLGLWLLALAIGFQVLPDSFDVFAEKQASSIPPWLTVALLIGIASTALPALVQVGLLLARPLYRWAGLSAALAISAPNNFALDGDYLGLHLFVELSAFGLACASLTNTAWPWRGDEIKALPKALWLAAVSSMMAAAASIAWPSSVVLQRLATIEGAPIAARVSWLRSFGRREKGAEAVLEQLPKSARPWFQRRDNPPPIAASVPSLLPNDPIVFLITIDSLRSDVFRNKRWLEQQHFFKNLSEHAVTFANAESPASSTVPTLSSLFTDKYYSTLFWKPVFEGGDVWPLEDNSVRFPELLSNHGVHTVNVATKSWLLSSRKVVAGFQEEYDLDQNAANRQKHVESGPILARMRESLGRPRTGPTFVYSHFMDPHSPYDSGKLKRGSDKKALYLSEIERLDEELAQFDQWLSDQGLGARVVWLVSADHGESFGEHGVTFHAKNIYEELVHVPLWIRIPGVKAARIEAPVSTMDLAPTLLDLFGVETPGEYMGQSLVPYLRGDEDVHLWRPIAAETHLKQSLLFADGFKAIRDQRSGTREVYDLKKDPKELKNLIDSANPKYQDALDLFFKVQLNPRYAKQAPYRH